MGQHRFRSRLEYEALPLPVETNLEPKRRLARYMEAQYLTLPNAGPVGISADHLIHPG